MVEYFNFNSNPWECEYVASNLSLSKEPRRSETFRSHTVSEMMITRVFRRSIRAAVRSAIAPPVSTGVAAATSLCSSSGSSDLPRLLCTLPNENLAVDAKLFPPIVVAPANVLSSEPIDAHDPSASTSPGCVEHACGLQPRARPFFADDAELAAYVAAETGHARSFFEDTADLLSQLTVEAQQIDWHDGYPVYEDPPERYGNSWVYWSQTGPATSGHVRHCRMSAAEWDARIDAGEDVVLTHDNGSTCVVNGSTSTDSTISPGKVETILDERELKSFDANYVYVSTVKLDDSHGVVAFLKDTTGEERFALGFRNLGTGTASSPSSAGARRGAKTVPSTSSFARFEIPDVRAVEMIGSYEPAEDAMTVMYSRVDGEALQAREIVLERIENLFEASPPGPRTTPKQVVLLAAEQQNSYVDVFKSKSGDVLFSSRISEGGNSTEIYSLPIAKATDIMSGDMIISPDHSGVSTSPRDYMHPGLRLVRPSESGVEYYCEYHRESENLVMISNHERSHPDTVGGFSVYVQADNAGLPCKPEASASPGVSHRKVLQPPIRVAIQDIDMFSNGLVLYCLREATPELVVISFSTSRERTKTSPHSALSSASTTPKTALEFFHGYQFDSSCISDIRIVQFPTSAHLEPGANSFYAASECQFTVETPISRARYALNLRKGGHQNACGDNRDAEGRPPHCVFETLLEACTSGNVSQLNKRRGASSYVDFSDDFEVEVAHVASRQGRFPVTIIHPSRKEEDPVVDTGSLLAQTHAKAALALADRAMTWRESGARMLGQMVHKLDRKSAGLPPFCSTVPSSKKITDGGCQKYLPVNSSTGTRSSSGVALDDIQRNAGGTACSWSTSSSSSSDIANSGGDSSEDQDEAPPTRYLIITYGAYGKPLSLRFRSEWVLYLRRGWTLVFAHLRGGGESGRARQHDKGHSIMDLRSCLQHLNARHQTQRARQLTNGAHDAKTTKNSRPLFVLKTASAGTLTAGGAALTDFDAVLLDVPFADPLGVMSDPSQPLVAHEREEWGDPLGDSTARRTLRSVSPLSALNFVSRSSSDMHVARQKLPHVFVSASRCDARVPLWVPSKFVASLRAARKTCGNGTLMQLVPAASGGKGRARRRGRSVESSANTVVFDVHEEGSHENLPFDAQLRQIIFLHKVLSFPQPL